MTNENFHIIVSLSPEIIGKLLLHSECIDWIQRQIIHKTRIIFVKFIEVVRVKWKGTNILSKISTLFCVDFVKCIRSIRYSLGTWSWVAKVTMLANPSNIFLRFPFAVIIFRHRSQFSHRTQLLIQDCKKFQIFRYKRIFLWNLTNRPP